MSLIIFQGGLLMKCEFVTVGVVTAEHAVLDYR